MPECYCVDEMFMKQERAQPGSTEMYPLSHTDFGHHLWGNSVYLILRLLREGLIHAADLDPINRRLPASQRPKLFNRHSAFQVRSPLLSFTEIARAPWKGIPSCRLPSSRSLLGCR